MQIIHIIESTATGTLSMVELLANQQVAQHEVTVIYSLREDTPKALQDIFDPRVKLHYIDMSPKHAAKSVWRLRQYIKTMPHAVVHCHSSVAGFLGRLAVWRLPNRCFYSPHCIAFMRTDISPFTRRVFVGLEKQALLFGHRYIACSHSEADYIQQYLPGAHVDTVENAVDFSAFVGSDAHDEMTQSEERLTPERLTPEPQTSEPHTNAPDDIHVITVGGIRPQKDPHAFAQIAAACPFPHVHFTWVGDGDEAAKKALCDAGVKVTGWCARAKVLAQVSRADIYLSTALWEGLPVALIEAQSVGAILLVNNCPGNTDVVTHGESGYVFSTVSQANEFLYNIINDMPAAKLLAADGPKQARQRFGVARYGAAIQSVYQHHSR